MIKFLTSLLLTALVVPSILFGSSPRPRVSAVQNNAERLYPSKKSWDFAAKTVKKMTVDEKVGQLVHVGLNARFANQESAFFKDIRRHVVDNKSGGIIFFGAPIYETTHIANRMQEAAKYPLLMSLDAETGIGMRFEDATNFPWAMAVAATGNPEFARRMGVVTGRGFVLDVRGVDRDAAGLLFRSRVNLRVALGFAAKRGSQHRRDRRR